ASGDKTAAVAELADLPVLVGNDPPVVGDVPEEQGGEAVSEDAGVVAGVQVAHRYGSGYRGGHCRASGAGCRGFVARPPCEAGPRSSRPAEGQPVLSWYSRNARSFTLSAPVRQCMYQPRRPIGSWFVPPNKCGMNSTAAE